MAYNMIVLAKQVPDTHNISGDVMKEDGTVNRAALPTIFNPEDLNALEEALKIKEQFGGKITVITMGPPNASEILRESLFRGADDVILLSDRKFAGADTLATSYVLAKAIKKIGNYDIVFCGRQAIDGDTAQVGPQVAEKLGINQVTFVDKINSINKNIIKVERSIDGGYEELEVTLPVLLTVTSEANIPRPPSVKKILTYKYAMTELEMKNYDEEYIQSNGIHKQHFLIKLWNHDDLGIDPEQCGLSGSPTKVKQIESVVLEAKEKKVITPDKEGLSLLISELMKEHIIG